MKSPAQEALFTKGVFQIQLPVSGINFSNNMPIPKLHETTFETSQPLNY